MLVPPTTRGVGADASLVCRRGSGVMAIREACTRKKSAVDLSLVGSDGFAGDDLEPVIPAADVAVQ